MQLIASFCPLNAFGTFGSKSTKNLNLEGLYEEEPKLQVVGFDESFMI